LRDEFNEIQSIIEGGKSIEVIELDENDVTMDENKEDDDVIEIAHFPPNLQAKDFFDMFTPPIFAPVDEDSKIIKLKLAFKLSQQNKSCQMCKDTFCLYDTERSINCLFCAGLCNNSTCEIKHIATNCAKSQCYGIDFDYE
jgi:hypothetical protein